MRHFIAHGYLLLHADFTADFHAAMHARIEDVMHREGNPGNNILPRVPEVFRHPVIRGAVGSVLGHNYITQPHRHCHFTSLGRKVQSWHKDSYWGYARIRNHHQWWAMIFYYPQDITPDMGPSGILPGTQYYDKHPEDDTEQPLFVEGRAGTFALIHYDLWHRGGTNLFTRNRAMLKFQFTRISRPRTPAWDNKETVWHPMNGEGPPHTHNALWADHWNWLSGRPHTLAEADFSPRHTVSQLADRVQSDYEPDGIGASYELAHLGAEGLPVLAELLHTGNQHVSRRAAYGLSAGTAASLLFLAAGMRHESDKVRAQALFAMGEHGPQARGLAADIANLVQDASPIVRRTAVETMGMLEEADTAVPALISALRDSDDQVRFTACLHDENRYVRGFSAEALRQIGTRDALNIVCAHLMETRWCHSTTPDSTF